nr:FeoC-like transcriptional regulator [Pseudomonas aeruginosa]
MQIRAALEDGQARGLKQLSRQVDAPPALVEAILERLIALGKVERVAAEEIGMGVVSYVSSVNKYYLAYERERVRLEPGVRAKTATAQK